MPTIHKTIKVSQEVTDSDPVKDSYTPPDGAEVFFNLLQGSGVRLEWGGDVIWTIKDNSRYEPLTQLLGADGVKKVEIICQKRDDGNLHMSGEAQIEVTT